MTPPAPGDSERPRTRDVPPPEAHPGALGLVTIGTVNATCWLTGIFLGWLCDRHFGTLPVFILVGLVIGSVTGTLSTYKEVRRYLSS